MESEVVVRRRPDGTAAEVHVYTRDVSERVEDHQALLTSEERYRFLAMNSTDLVMRIDQTGLITFASPSVKTILGYEVRALIDTAVHDLVHRDDRDTSTAWMAGVRQLDDTIPEPFRFRMVRADGTPVWTETTMVAATGPDGAAVTEIQTSTRVVAQQVEAHERLQRSEQRFRAAVASSPMAVALVTPDHKVSLVNEAACRFLQATASELAGVDWRSWIHPIDQSLVIEAPVAARSVGPMALRFCDTSDDIRWGRATVTDLEGGTGFLVQIQDVTAERRRAELLMTQLARVASGTEPTDHIDPASVPGPAGRESKDGQYRMDQLIADATAEGWFRVHYQPIVDLATRHVVGREALVRIEHPTDGTLRPSAFLSRAEETGAIIELGRWVIDEAIATTAQRHRSGDAAWVAVNLSVAQLCQDDLVGLVQDAASRQGLALADIHLEVTESLLLLPESAGRAEVERLNTLGCEISLDDFGTGFSSLTYLRQPPVSALKLDRSSVSEVGREDQSTAIVAAVLDLARGLGLDVVAEGVETEQQAAALLAMGCPRAQGYLFGRPEPY